MKKLKIGARSPSVQLLQLALERAGYDVGGTDGVFGQKTHAAVVAFQRANGLSQDGIVGAETTRYLMPWYTGYTLHTVKSGDTLYSIAASHGATLLALETANPNIDPLNLRIGESVVVPLPFEVVPTGIDYCSALVGYCVRGLAARYPFLRVGEMGKSVMGKPLYLLSAGSGERHVFYNAEHHANEWITTPVLLKFMEQLAAAFVYGGSIGGFDAGEIFERCTITAAPAVNPDGLDLVTGELTDGAYFDAAVKISQAFPDIPFPSGWKANIRGVDLNLQYPAGWTNAREIKFAQGFTQPAPRDYVGASPLSAPESRAMFMQTLNLDPQATLPYHTQGEVIYWRYLDMEPPGSRALAQELGSASGYAVEETPYASGFAGYKDWFIQEFDRPGFTIECGLGQNPLPISEFDGIYAKNVGILARCAMG
jgi:g-D-glutamyl-meso-diaminopimelate peptidase